MKNISNQKKKTGLRTSEINSKHINKSKIRQTKLCVIT